MSETDPATTSRPSHRPRTAGRIRLGVGSAIIIVIVLVSASVGVSLLRNMAAPAHTIAVSEPAAVDTAVSEAGLYVHVAGHVIAPGIYRLDIDARVVDAVAAAGGVTAEADLDAINLARVVSDGEQLVVPAIGEAAVEAAAGVSSDGTVNINTADAATLETLPRVGPALAQRIIEWRESNGAFRSVDDLLGVSGIGEKMLAGLRDRVSL